MLSHVYDTIASWTLGASQCLKAQSVVSQRAEYHQLPQCHLLASTLHMFVLMHKLPKNSLTGTSQDPHWHGARALRYSGVEGRLK